MNRSEYNDNQEVLRSGFKEIFDTFSDSKSKYAEIAKRGFAVSKIKNSKILFVGINPSFPNNAESESFFFDANRAIDDYKRYFGKFKLLADTVNWAYLDLFSFRETNQKIVFKLISEPEGLQFIIQQLRITQDTLEALKPELIVVCNRAARTFFGVDKLINIKGDLENIWMSYEFEFNEKLGVNIISGLNHNSIKENKVTSLINTPVLFTSILTYMDKSTRKNLQWHIHHVLRGT